MIDDDNERDGFAERPTPFVPSLDSLVAFYRFGQEVYAFRCAISGLIFPASRGALHSNLEVVFIHPREAGGPLDVRNILVLETRFARAFSQGFLCVDDDYRVLVSRSDALGEDVLALVTPGRRLFLPSEAEFWPLKSHLHFHRLVIATYKP